MANDAFEKFKSSVNRGITTISVKTSSTLEKTKIKTHIETLERDINKLFHNLGEAAYEKWVKENLDYSSFPFARRYLGNHYLFSLPAGT